jgi:energy-coupling factor transport system ATP-binding protein
MPITLRDLAFSYFEDQVIASVNGTFDDGLVHLVLGATGSGKTTLALVLAGLLKPSRGTVTVDGCDPASDRFDRSRLQLAFQFPEVQIFESSVEREIEYGLRNFGLPSEEIVRRRDWALECVGLAPALLPRDPSGLSFGERRKVALASVIALKPAYLVLDEPLAGLDWHGRQNLVATILRLKAEGLTSLVLTHEADLVGEMGDTVSVMAGGSLSGPMPVDVFLGSGLDLVPDFVHIIQELQARGYAIDGRPAQAEAIASVVLRALGLQGD